MDNGNDSRIANPRYGRLPVCATVVLSSCARNQAELNFAVVFIPNGRYIHPMTRGERMIAGVLAGVVLGMPTQSFPADIPGNPYQGIVERNLFNLKPPPGPEDNLPPPAPPPKITLTGITTILGNKRVLFKVQVPPRPPAPPKEESYILSEGQRDGDIEVLEIDETGGVVKFNNHGTIQTLDLTNDATKPPNSSPPAGVRPGTPIRGPVGQNPNGPPADQAAKTIPSRTLRLSPAPGAAAGRTIPGFPGSRSTDGR